jgi:hypothetical protein
MALKQLLPSVPMLTRIRSTSKNKKQRGTYQKVGEKDND